MRTAHPVAETNVYITQPVFTPLVPVQLADDGPIIWCKLEYMNPSGSTKDRIAAFILGKALRQGTLQPGDEVIEASSGSTSIAMAMACAQFRLRFTAVMPEGVSNERTIMVKGYGGEVSFSPREEGIAGAVALSERLAAERGAFLPKQFQNPDNPAAHRHQTAQEIVAQMPDGLIDAVVSGVGTGGTLVGLFQGFTDFGCRVVPFSAKPVTGRALPEMECCSFSCRIPGVIENLSEIYNQAELPGLVELEIDDSAALEVTRCLIAKGFPVGPSSGLNYQGSLQACEQLEPGARVVTVFPDRMERYFSTELFRALK